MTYTPVWSTLKTCPQNPDRTWNFAHGCWEISDQDAIERAYFAANPTEGRPSKIKKVK